MQALRPIKTVLALISRRPGLIKVKINLNRINPFHSLRLITLKNALTNLNNEIINVEHAKIKIKHSKTKHDPKIKALTKLIIDRQTFRQQWSWLRPE